MENPNFPQFINEKTGEYVPYPPDATEFYRFLVKFKVSQYSDPDYRVMRWSNHDDTFVIDDDLQLPLPKTAEIRSFINVFKLDQGWNIPAPEVAKSLSLEERLEAWHRTRGKVGLMSMSISSVIEFPERVKKGISEDQNEAYNLEEALLLREFLQEFPEIFEEENINKIIQVYPWYSIFFDAWEAFDLAVTALEKKGEGITEDNPACKDVVDLFKGIRKETFKAYKAFQKYEEVKNDRKET
jgi:hypothetical protein